MDDSITGTLLLIVVGLVTYMGFRDRNYLNKYIFQVDRILINKEYYRLISSGFLHGSWLHFGFNMVALLSFSGFLEQVVGYFTFLFIYFASLVGGSLLSLYFHSNHGDYRALGASGAVSGVVFATILVEPFGGIGIILLPFTIQSWLFGLLFILVSLYGMKAQWGNIGHEAHLGGALIGGALILLIFPSIITQHLWIVLLLFIPPLLILFAMIRNPTILVLNKKWKNPFNFNQFRYYQFKRPKFGGFGNNNSRPGVAPKDKQEELNELLDKIKRGGIKSLSRKERKRLDELSR